MPDVSQHLDADLAAAGLAPGNQVPGQVSPSQVDSMGMRELVDVFGPGLLEVSLHVRVGPDDVPEIDPALGDVAAQEGSIATWREVWKHAVPNNRYLKSDRDLAAVMFAKDSFRGSPVLNARNAYQRIRWDLVPDVRPEAFHFHEDARRVEAVLRSGLKASVTSPRGYLTFLNGGERKATGRGALPLPLCSYPETSGCDQYWKNPAFLKNAGRPLVPCGPGDLHWVAMAFAELGHERVFVKSTVVKRGTWTVELPGSGGAPAFRRAVREALGEEFHDPVSGKDEPGFFVQPHVGFHHEARISVLGGRIVQAVPVRRLDSVYMSDPRLRVEPRSCQAHDGFPSLPDRGRAAAYVRAARRIVADLVADGIADGNFVIDMGETSDGRILPVELNSLLLAGTYSADPCRLLSAYILRKARDAARKRVEHATRMAAAADPMSGPDRTSLKEFLAAILTKSPGSTS